jgi:hypothetical protein
MKMRMAKVFFFTFAVLITSCNSCKLDLPGENNNIGLPQVVMPYDAGDRPTIANTVVACNIRIRWNYTDKTVDFRNTFSQHDIRIEHSIGGKGVSTFVLAPLSRTKIKSSFIIGDVARVSVNILSAEPESMTEGCQQSFVLGR